MAESCFANVTQAQGIEVFALTASFNKDSHPNKVNLGVGAYRTDEGKPWVLPVVRDAEAAMAADQTINHEYFPVAGFPDYRAGGTRLLLGAESPAIAENRADAIQAIGGTGALRVGLDFLRTRMDRSVLYISAPTWGNHKSIGKALGYDVREYRYWGQEKRGLDFEGYMEDMQNAPEGSVFLLHSCAHNPTGMDPSEEQWRRIAEVVREKNHFPFFDCAYQGFSTGDLEKDASAVRYFVQEGFELFAAQSFSKNFGLYNERVGNLIVVTRTNDELCRVRSQMEIVVRTTWSNPPAHGARVVASVLNNPAPFTQWKAHVKAMADRILLMRKLLLDKLRALGTPGSWDHITKQTGMFSYTGLNERQAVCLKDDYHIYLLKSGRINMCGLTSQNIDYVANAIHEVVCKNVDDPKL